jgi:hypothetical protein
VSWHKSGTHMSVNGWRGSLSVQVGCQTTPDALHAREERGKLTPTPCSTGSLKRTCELEEGPCSGHRSPCRAAHHLHADCVEEGSREVDDMQELIEIMECPLKPLKARPKHDKRPRAHRVSPFVRPFGRCVRVCIRSLGTCP